MTDTIANLGGWIKNGESLLEKTIVEADALEIIADGFENCDRKVQLLKVPQAYKIFKEIKINHQLLLKYILTIIVSI